MKILVIFPNPFFADRGSCIRTYGQVKYLQKIGNEIVILSYPAGREIEDFNIKRIIKLPGYSEDRIGASFSRLYLDLFLLLKSIYYNLKYKPDIIHGHLHEGAIIGIISSLFRKTTVFLDAEGSLSGELRDRAGIKNKLLLKIIYLVERWINLTVDCIVVSSPIIADDMNKRLLIDMNSINIVPDGINIDNEIVKNYELLEKIGISKHKRIIVYAGVLDPFYGIDCLLESAKIVISKLQNIHFLIIGYPNVEKYVEMSKNLGISEYFSFVGKIKYEQILKYLSLGEIAVAPKLKGTEGTLKLSHYMVAGLPVVAFDTISSKEILGEYGIYANSSGSPIDLANAILSALNNPNIKTISQGVKNRVKNEFSLDVINEKLNKIYIDCMRKQ